MQRFRDAILLKHKTVLFIDDDQDEHLLIRDAVAGNQNLPGFTYFFSAQLALRELETTRSIPDLIVVDINMPVMNGVEFLTEIKKRAHLKHIPVIIHTTTGDAATRKTCEDLGAVAFLRKATNFDALLSTIRGLLLTSALSA